MSGNHRNNLPHRLLWIDVETTGLNPASDLLLEMEMRVTDLQTKQAKTSLHTVIAPRRTYTDGPSAWAQRTHRNNRLLEESRTGLKQASAQRMFAAWLRRQTKQAILHPAGSSVHFDTKWLDQTMPGLLKNTSHQHMDVSSLRILLNTIRPALAHRISERIPATDHRTSHCLDRDIAEYQMMLDGLKAAGGGRSPLAEALSGSEVHSFKAEHPFDKPSRDSEAEMPQGGHYPPDDLWNGGRL